MKKKDKTPMTDPDYEPFKEIIDEVYYWEDPSEEAAEKRPKEEMQALLIGAAMKKARFFQGLSQEKLGERLGVKKSQISKIENGKSTLTLPALTRIFKALGFESATLCLGKHEKVELW